MGVQRFLKSALKASMKTFDAEPIQIGAQTIDAVMDMTTGGDPLGMGGTKGERTLVVTFPADSFTGPLKSGQAIMARGEKWQISAGDNAVQRGQIAITLTLVEPGRRDY